MLHNNYYFPCKYSIQCKIGSSPKLTDLSSVYIINILRCLCPPKVYELYYNIIANNNRFISNATTYVA